MRLGRHTRMPFRAGTMWLAAGHIGPRRRDRWMRQSHARPHSVLNAVLGEHGSWGWPAALPEPPPGIEPGTYALRGRRCTAPSALPALMPHPSALIALHDPGKRCSSCQPSCHTARGAADQRCVEGREDLGGRRVESASSMLSTVAGSAGVADSHQRQQRTDRGLLPVVVRAVDASGGWLTNRSRASSSLK